MITLKIKYSTDSENYKTIFEYQKQYSTLLRLFYNRRKEGLQETEIKHLQYNNLDLMKSWLRQSCVKEASFLLKRFKESTLIFGGKFNFLQRCQGKISRENFLQNRILPLNSIGGSSFKGNLLFQIQEDLHSIIFQPTRKEKIKLNLIGLGKRIKFLKGLYKFQQEKIAPISYKLDQKFIYISFDEELFQEKIKTISNRICAIDMNPNYIGFSIVDWKKDNSFVLIDKGILTLKSLNDYDFSLKGQHFSSESKERKYLCNKRNHEIYECVKFLIERAKHFQCQTFAIEDLNFKSQKAEGKQRNSSKFNRLVTNLWCRGILVSNLRKRCCLAGIHFQEVIPNYSSILGNLAFRKLNLPDMILASIEISRRANEFYQQYISKTKEKAKVIVLPFLSDNLKRMITQSLEELGCCSVWETWSQLFALIKNSKLIYRVPVSNETVLRQNHFRFQKILNFLEENYPSRIKILVDNNL